MKKSIHLTRATTLMIAIFCCTGIAGGLLGFYLYHTQGNRILLWPGLPPGARGIYSTDIPTLAPYLPENRQQKIPAIVICPGGGYGNLALHEGRQVAEWFRSQGIAAFLLRYRLPKKGYRHPYPFLDAQRALRLVRYHAAKWHVNPHAIGIIGFSAGGHLAATVGTRFEAVHRSPKDAIDRTSARPDFMVLAYPVVTMSKEYTHGGSRNNLVGGQASDELLAYLSNELHVSAVTPPTYLVHANDDPGVSVQNSIALHTALQKAGIPTHLQIIPAGEHGFGLGRKEHPQTIGWANSCIEWLHGQGILTEDRRL